MSEAMDDEAKRNAWRKVTEEQFRRLLESYCVRMSILDAVLSGCEPGDEKPTEPDDQ